MTSKIEWTDRSDWNPVRGCTRVSPGCGGPGPNGGCYAEMMAARFSKPGMWGHGFAEMSGGRPRWTGKVELIEERLLIPLTWRDPARCFPNSTSDFFHEGLSDEDIDKIFAVAALTPHITYQIPTKRADRMRDYCNQDRRRPRWLAAQNIGHAAGVVRKIDMHWPLPNVWLGVSVEDQARANERIPALLQTPAAKRFLSCEPLLGPVNLRLLELGDEIYLDAISGAHHATSSPMHLTDVLANMQSGADPFPALPPILPGIDWVIAGGESGPRARPAHPDWFRSLRDQCAASKVPFFFKQWGEYVAGYLTGSRHTMLLQPANGPESGIVLGAPPHSPSYVHVWDEATGLVSARVGKGKSGRTLDGREHNEFPAAS